jgi:four helix bundle protein
LGKSFQELIVWQRAIETTVAVYRLTSEFPNQEQYGLTNQIRRATVSVASNIAEGYGRATSGEYKHFLGVARGSNSEVATQFVIFRQLSFGDTKKIDEAEKLVGEVGKMLSAIMKTL